MSPSSSGPVRLGQLLSMSFAFTKMHWKPVLIGAVVFGTISALLIAPVQHKAGGQFGRMMQGMGMDLEKMEQLSERMQAGDESASDEIEALLEDRFGGSDEEKAFYTGMMTAGVFRTVAPYIALSVLIGFLLWVLSNAYFLVLALGTIDAQKAAKRVPGLFFPLLGVWIWMFLRSFAWIPFIGIIPGIILGPRFALAPVILVQEKKGVMQSVSESYARTSGYWGKIVGNMIVMIICVVVASMLVGIVAGILGAMVPFVGMWIMSVAKYVLMAFGVTFMVQLSLTIMQNRIAKK